MFEICLLAFCHRFSNPLNLTDLFNLERQLIASFFLHIPECVNAIQVQ